MKEQRGDEVYLYSFFNLGARWGWAIYGTPWLLYPLEGPGTHCTGGWVRPRVRLVYCGKSRRRRVSISGPFSP